VLVDRSFFTESLNPGRGFGSYVRPVFLDALILRLALYIFNGLVSDMDTSRTWTHDWLYF